MNLKDKLARDIKNGKLAGRTEREICRALHIPRNDEKNVRSALLELIDEGAIWRDGSQFFPMPSEKKLIPGTVSGNKKGFGFLIPDDSHAYPKDFFIPRRSINGAMHGDRVLAVRRNSYDPASDEVAIVRILKRNYTDIVGTLYRDGNNFFLYPDEEKISRDLFIPRGKTMGAQPGEKAVAHITVYPSERAFDGEITEILGESGDFDIEELSLIRAHGLREEFPEEVLQAASAMPQSVPQEALEGRTDFRDKLIITIDGEDTRDIDDAISVERTENGFILGVHIADVSHYVPYGSILDKEAYRRATSVYFPDRVLPMLPRELSNGICSLNEGVDRLTLSCVMFIGRDGRVQKRKITKSVIRSAHRMTYHAIEKIANGDAEAAQSHPDLVQFVRDCYELTEILREMRHKKGEIELDIKEAKIMVTDDGEIIIPDYERLYSQQMIEAFMVLANEQVAEYMTEKKAPFIYRIHEPPKEEKAEELKQFLISLGIPAQYDSANVSPDDYRAILKKAEDMPEYSIINRVMLRSMMKARYESSNVGHFGLSSECYCHFTSPIRRYPDLCIHRVIKLVLENRLEKAKELYGDFVSEAAKQSSECERVAIEAERDVESLYMTEYMAGHLGQDYDGIISGVTSHGFFVELANTVEGFVSYGSLPDDEYVFFEERFLLRGHRNSFRIGDGVRIRVAGTDFGNRKIDFQFLQKL